MIKIGGIYKHFKNHKLYKIICLAKHSETMEDMVVYEPQYESENKIWVRPALMFDEEVEFDGKRQKRFQLVES
ncbi:MAG: hypothetical protein A3G52_03200 [Candidatus Taylorbacteria bacterium RIFCSPLOWO2_12_FULL_43_20]|uniref:DUF1653 domain-containing protein n=1 Tax=Candidatus Taylorbacteria bacterium RIFCSPLOWO2_12_FULL_43_20 TaxID=1802332 RepID=A0A1G2P362_9BACT|nr:MAG: hypothetical protein A2825_03645 [Candidatus Taylorbacteria bacterium RIFCSPHIGHO2_01_FULL_43_120]OHA22042.1 MAG: hypothetical protein A3B98_04030 [Candidatus Taylorbacteria bacterium RIFCSPHIGHO2_02_FULL_43_55]OHA30379.1 MAG: hypothetical protein A3E92_00745 [Candidatus Taylorbacteria bacterium RIFCSPHIGHO2_12_FULL_42_34]OHA31539.1 MAG: hypothetical protein A3B09_00750 [Candidatus Taylorbacteria bacterium RIFCSPLOWO2_01_FULL_43_83]OHA39749.1 MAG: hypothetical protein A3H58_04825 [Candi